MWFELFPLKFPISNIFKGFNIRIKTYIDFPSLSHIEPPGSSGYPPYLASK
jgi:hypothetical protein